MHFGCLLCLFFTNSSFGTSFHITNTIDTKSGGLIFQMLSSLNEEPNHFDNTFFSAGSKLVDANENFTTTIEEVLVGNNDNKNINVFGNIEHYKKNRKLFFVNTFFYLLK